MPRPTHTRFCPQCGCTAAANALRMETHERVEFTCGEIVTRVGDALRTSYTCKTVPGMVEALEDSFDKALVMALRSPIAAGVRAWMRTASMNPDGEFPRPLMPQTMAYLADMGIAVVVKNTDPVRLRLTFLGRRLAQRMHPAGDPQ